MPSYKKLVVFALAASTVYPALAAPIREGRNKPPADLKERSLLGLLLETIGINEVASAVLKHASRHDSGSAASASAMKRTTETSESQTITEMEGRALGDHNLDKRISNPLTIALDTLVGMAGMMFGSAFSRVRRKGLSPGDMLSHRDVAEADVLDALSRFARALDELD